MQTDTKPTTGIEFRAVIASSEDEGELQRVVINLTARCLSLT